MTRADHQSGNRTVGGSAVEKCGFSDDTVIGERSGDEPMIPALLFAVSRKIWRSAVGMATLAVPDHSAEEALLNPNAVKVVLDAEGWRALLPFPGDDSPRSRSLCKKSGNGRGYCLRQFRHLWLSRGFIRRYVSWQTQPAETY